MFILQDDSGGGRKEKCVEWRSRKMFVSQMPSWMSSREYVDEMPTHSLYTWLTLQVGRYQGGVGRLVWGF